MRVSSLIGPWVAFAAIITLLPAAGAAEEPDIVGAYKCVGDAGNGKQYEGKAKIAKDGDCYKVTWEIAAQRYTGLAIRDGDALSVAIHDDADDKYTGLIVYRLGKGGKLVGRWSTFGFKGMILTETLTPDK